MGIVDKKSHQQLNYMGLVNQNSHQQSVVSGPGPCNETLLTSWRIRTVAVIPVRHHLQLLMHTLM